MKKETSIKNLQNRLLIIYCILVVSIALIISVLFLRRSTDAIKKNAINLLSANTRQIELNMNSYFDKIEGTTALLFSDENYYKYDETSDKYDDYTKLQYEDGIKTKIIDLGIMDNYADFGIVYSDDYTVGWISKTTKALYKDQGLYSVASSHIDSDKKNDGWFYNINEGLDKLYYVKRLNDNAIAIASIYCRELETVFTVPEELEGITIRLVNDENLIIYSSTKEEAGQMLPEEVTASLSEDMNISYIKDSIIDVDNCENGWRIVTIVPDNIILQELQQLETVTFTTAIILIGLFVIAGVSIFVRLAHPVDNMVADLETKAQLDGLTGILNKKAFENKIEEELEHTVTGSTVAHILMDVDHFKSINDNLGHAYGDQFIVKTAEVLKNMIPSTAILGRIGGDEFSFMLKEPDKSEEEMKEYVKEILTNLSSEFIKAFEKEYKEYEVSLSLGVNIFNYKGESFKDIYKRADEALYNSKENGRNQFTFYMEEGMK